MTRVLEVACTAGTAMLNWLTRGAAAWAGAAKVRSSATQSRLRRTSSQHALPREVAQIALRVDLPARSHLCELWRKSPTVRPLLTAVVRRGALKRHAARVVADRADLH